MTSLLMWGMVLGAAISLFTFWVTFAIIVNPKLKRTFEIELETKREFIRGIVTAKELTNKAQRKRVKIGVVEKGGKNNVLNMRSFKQRNANRS